MLTGGAWLYLIVVSVFAGFLQTLTGFGYALAAAPLLALIMDPKDVVMFVLFTGMIVKTVMVWKTHGEGKFADILGMFVASLAGALPGVVVMAYVSSEVLKILIGVVLLAATVLMHRKTTVKIANKTMAQGGAGFVSGFLASTTSLNGPPIVLYYMNENTPKETMRANLSRYFVLGNGAALMMSWFMGTLNIKSVAMNAAISIPALMIGFWLGEKLFHKVDAQIFRRLALGVVMVGGVVTLTSGLWSWLH